MDEETTIKSIYVWDILEGLEMLKENPPKSFYVGFPDDVGRRFEDLDNAIEFFKKRKSELRKQIDESIKNDSNDLPKVIKGDGYTITISNVDGKNRKSRKN